MACAEDIFSQAYYLFALHAKRRSAAYRAAALGLNPAPATAASSAAPADAADAADRAGNVLDMLASLSVTATAREAARGSTDGEKVRHCACTRASATMPACHV